MNYSALLSSAARSQVNSDGDSSSSCEKRPEPTKISSHERQQTKGFRSRTEKTKE